MAANKTPLPSGKGKKIIGGKSRKHTKSSSSDTQDEIKRDCESSEQARYAVFKSSTIECFAEQYMNADDLSLSPEFCSRLAADATYKLYELIHNVKTLAHPVGGVVTTDIVNEAIKLADVPPILGPPKPLYEDIGYEEDDKQHFFVHDSLVHILDEIQNEIFVEQTGPLGMKVGYFLTHRDTALIQTFYTKICRALLSGSSNTLKECLQLLRTIEQFEPVLPNLLTLCALLLKKYLHTLINNEGSNHKIDEESKVMYERVLLILLALSNNHSIRSATVHNELYQIVQQLTQILFLCVNINTEQPFSSTTDSKTANIESFIKLEIEDEIKIEIDNDRKFETSDQIDISIIDENNSSRVMNLNDIIECKNIFTQDQETKLPNCRTKKSDLSDIDNIEKICNVLIAIGENWLCIRGKIIEVLLPNLSCDEDDIQNMLQMKLLAMATARLLYQFDNETYFELDYWMYEVYGESIILQRPIRHVSELDLHI